MSLSGTRWREQLVRTKRAAGPEASALQARPGDTIAPRRTIEPAKKYVVWNNKLNYK